jgi:chloramphenicol 3-O phosphotransferase
MTGQPDVTQTSIIFLNGASSSGKSTLGRALRGVLETPYFYFSSDQLVDAQVVPPLDRTRAEGQARWREIRPRFFDGFHRAIAALAAAGNPLIVEHVLEQRSWFEDCVRLLEPFDVLFVGVHCPLDELERRERARGDRRIGEGRSHLEDGIHMWSRYDLQVNTVERSPLENAMLIRAALSERRLPTAFQRALATLSR